MKRKVVWVRWVDACHWADDWYRSSDRQLANDAGMMVESAGVLMRDDEAGLVIAVDLDPTDGRYRHVSFIPKGMVRKKKVFIVDG